MDKSNENPDGSKKRKRDEDEDKIDSFAAVIKRHRDEEDKKREGEASLQRSNEESSMITHPIPIADSSTPGCSYNWRAQPAEAQQMQTQVEFENASMEWRQENKTEVEEDAKADSGCSGFSEETEEGDDDEEREATCNLVSRTVYEWEDESWEDEFVLRINSITFREPREPTFGPEINPLYNAETAMQEGWDWPDPDEGNLMQYAELDDNRDVLVLEEWVVNPEIEVGRLINEGESLTNEDEMEGEVMNP